MDSKMDERTLEQLLETLTLQTVIERVGGVGGVWVHGQIGGHRFSALVFPRPAVNPAWEVTPGCRISKLCLKRLDDDALVFNWDRGEDMAPSTATAAQIVGLLASGLADRVWGGGFGLDLRRNSRRLATSCGR